MNDHETDPAFEAAVDKALRIYTLHFPKGRADMAGAITAGMVARDALRDGMMYAGYCRNATTAVWHANKGCFVIMRRKFGDTFPEDVPHPADDDGFDVFVPIMEMGT